MLLIVFACLCGCHVTAATPATAPALPAGAYDQTDAKANQTLQSMHAFALKMVDGPLTAAQAALLNKLDAALNVADAAEQSYHACLAATGIAPSATTGPNGPCLTAAGLTAALTAANTAFTTAQAGLTPAS